MEILFPDRLSTRRSIPYHTAFYNMHRYRGIWEGADSHTPPLGKLFIKFTNFKIPENRLRAPQLHMIQKLKDAKKNVIYHICMVYDIFFVQIKIHVGY